MLFAHLFTLGEHWETNPIYIIMFHSLETHNDY